MDWLRQSPDWALAAGFVSSASVWSWLVFRFGRFIGHRSRLGAAGEGARRQITGRVAELWAPYEDGFPGTPDEASFLGAPIDFVVFEGLSDGHVEDIVFVEVKSGEGKLTARERMIRDAVRDRRVSWMEFRIDER